MTKNIVELKEMFKSLSRLKVTSLTLPHDEYWEIRDLFNLESTTLTYCNDGVSWNFEARFNPEEFFCVYGVKVENEGI